MPPKKKNKKQNGFYMYMIDKKRSFEIELNRDLTMADLVPLAHPGWKELSTEEKLAYNVRAKTYGQERKYEEVDVGKMDCTGQLISERIDRMALNESRRSQERRQLIEKWLAGHAVCMETFHMIAFETLCELPDEKGYLPCEIACVSFSLYAGIIGSYHKFIEPGRLPVGFRYQCQHKSDNTHKVPIQNFELSTDNYRQVWIELCDFLNPQRQSAFPPVFCQLERRNEVEGCLRWLSDRAGVHNRLAKVYEMEVLVCELFVHGGAKPPSHSGCTNLLTTSAFDYEADTRCKYHEENEVAMDHCALGKVKKNCFCLSDSLASTYNIELTSNHLPERQDVSTCLVIPPSVYGIQFSNAKPQRKPPQNPSARGRGLDVDYKRREPHANAASTSASNVAAKNDAVEKPDIQDVPLRRPTSVSVTGFLATKQIQPMKDREMGTKMAMLQPSAGSPSKFALPASAPPPSSLPLPVLSWQGTVGPTPGQGDISNDLASKSQDRSGLGLGRGLGRGLSRGTFS